MFRRRYCVFRCRWLPLGLRLPCCVCCLALLASPPFFLSSGGARPSLLHRARSLIAAASPLLPPPWRRSPPRALPLRVTMVGFRFRVSCSPALGVFFLFARGSSLPSLLLPDSCFFCRISSLARPLLDRAQPASCHLCSFSTFIWHAGPVLLLHMIASDFFPFPSLPLSGLPAP